MTPKFVADTLAVMGMSAEADCVGRLILDKQALEYYINESKELQKDLVKMTHRAVAAEFLLIRAHELCEAISLGVVSRNNAENLAAELDAAIQEIKRR